MAKAFIKMMRSQELLEMLRDDPNLFRLLTLIALRINLFDHSHPYGCRIGEALVSAKAVGLKPSSFRTARRKLERRGVAEFDIRREGSTTRTFAKLSSPRFFDVNLESFRSEYETSNDLSVLSEVTPGLTSESSGEIPCISITKKKNKRGGKLPTNSGTLPIRSRNGAKQEVMKMGRKEIEETLPLSQCLLTQQFIRSIAERIEAPIPFDLQAWEKVLSKIVHDDNVDVERLEEVIQWVASNDFWRGVILSPQKMREHLPKLLLQMNSKSSKGVLDKETLQEDNNLTFR